MSKKTFYQNLDSTLGDTFNVNEAFSLVRYDRNVYFSWGSHNVVNLKNKGLLFTVNGLKHKGLVLVTYNSCPDLYTVTLLSSQYNVKHTSSHIYCDELQEKIDNLIEKQDYYTRPVVKPTFG